MDSSSSHKGTGTFLRQTALQLIVALGVYFGMRAFGFAPYIAIAATGFAAIVHMVVNLVRGQKADVIVVSLVLLYGTGSTVALATRNPRYAQLMNLSLGMAIMLALLVSAIVGRPLTTFVVAQYWPPLARDALPARGWSARDIQNYASMNRRTSFACGAAGVVQAVVSVFVILTYSTDVAQLFCGVVGTGTTVAIILLAVRSIRRFVRATDAAASVESGRSSR